MLWSYVIIDWRINLDFYMSVHFSVLKNINFLLFILLILLIFLIFLLFFFFNLFKIYSFLNSFSARFF